MPETLPVGIYNKNKDNIIVIIDQFKKRVETIKEYSKEMRFNVISTLHNDTRQNDSLFRYIYKKNSLPVINELEKLCSDNNKSVNLFLSGISITKTNILELLSQNIELIKKLNRIKITSCPQSFGEVHFKIDNSEEIKKNIQIVHYDSNEIHGIYSFNPDLLINTLGDLFEIEYPND